MKTTRQILSFALMGLIITSCSTSMYMSKSSINPADDVYYTPKKSTTTLVADNNSNIINDNVLKQNSSSTNLDRLEEKYTKELASDTIKNENLVSEADSLNPYESVLSDSYEESYERRLRGREDPRYGMSNYYLNLSDAYFYASAYDPSLYNIVVMGDQVWVEPWYISNMFWSPRSYFRFGLGVSLWSYWGLNSWWNPYYNNYYGYNSWNGWNPYWNNYSYGYWGNGNWYNSYGSNGDVHYGRRIDNRNYFTNPNRNPGDLDNKIVTSRRRGETVGSQTTETRNGSVNDPIRTRNTTTQTTTRNGSTRQVGNQEVIRRPNRTNDINQTRLRGERPTRETNSTEPTRRTSDSNIQRPRSTNSNDYIRSSTRNQNLNEGTSTRGSNTRSTSPTRETRETRQPSPTYNTPSRVSTPSTRERSGSSGGSSVRESSSSSRPSSSGSSSSSSSTSSSSSSSSGNNSSGSSGDRRR